MHLKFARFKVITQAKRLELNIPTVSLSRTYNTLRRLHHGMYYRGHSNMRDHVTVHVRKDVYLDNDVHSSRGISAKRKKSKTDTD